MAYQLIELSSSDELPDLACDRGVTPIAAADRQRHRPDGTLLLVDGHSLAARCSCWWSGRENAGDSPYGAIGHYAAADAAAGVALLRGACATLASHGEVTAVGPMDGNTWRRYRFVVDRGAEPAFFLEPDNPDEWPEHWTRAGFSPLATYSSAVNDDLTREDSRTATARARVGQAGISIRALDPSRVETELHRIFQLSLAAFARNFLYTPIAEAEFLTQYHALLPSIRPELVLLAERGEALVGVMMALPDLLQARRGADVDTVILKTIAVHPSVAGIGLGGLLIDHVQRAARELGFRRAIHALMHDANASRTISDRYARTFRRYALFARTLSA